MIAKAIRDKINGDTGVGGVAGQLDTFDFGSGPEPAIFTFDDVDERPPEDQDSANPAVFIQAAGGINFSDRCSDGAKLTMRVTVWGDRERGSIQLLARDIFLLLNKATLTQTGVNIFGVLADPPALLSDPEGFPGYLINVSAFVEYGD